MKERIYKRKIVGKTVTVGLKGEKKGKYAWELLKELEY